MGPKRDANFIED
jgi:Ion transport protein